MSIKTIIWNFTMGNNNEVMHLIELVNGQAMLKTSNDMKVLGLIK